MWLNAVSLLNFACLCLSDIHWNFSPDSQIIFHAYVDEKAQNVVVYPPLSVRLDKGSTLCALKLIPTEKMDVPDFISGQTLDVNQGVGGIKFNEPLFYAARKRGDKSARTGFYHLRIQAYDCSRPPLATTTWPINFEHIPTDLPVWSERQYVFQVDSSLVPGHQAGKVTAYASVKPNSNVDGTHQLGDITGMCNYTLDDPTGSFTIDGHGIIRSQVYFNRTANQVYQLNVTGQDCTYPNPRSSHVMVTINVQPECLSKWQGVPHVISYSALSNPYILAPEATLYVCPPSNQNSTSSDCTLNQAVCRLKILWSKEDILGFQNDQSVQCDLDLLSIRQSRRVCSNLTVKDSSVELLPQFESNEYDLPHQPKLMNLSKLSHWNPVFSKTRNENNNMKYDQYPSGIYYFNGSNFWDLNYLPIFQSTSRFDNDYFTLNFWMKHSFTGGLTNDREHIFCISDGSKKNRHHFAVFIQNCKLVTLIRRESSNVNDRFDAKNLLPAHWRFDVEEICDSNWHHYSIVYRPPPDEVVQGKTSQSGDWNVFLELQLFIDGLLIPNDPELVEISDDKPLTSHKNDFNPKNFLRSSVGACWHSRTTNYAQFFKGYLGGMTFTKGTAQNYDYLRCLTNCEPRLFMQDRPINMKNQQLTSLQTSHLSNVIIQSTTIPELTDILRKITYFNPRLQFKPRDRPEPVAIQVSTTLRYTSECQPTSVIDQTILINHLPPMLQSIEALYSPLLQSTTTMPEDSEPKSSGLIKSTEQDYSSIALWINRQYPERFTSFQISRTDLMNGVQVFPDVDLVWKFSSHSDGIPESVSILEHSVSLCTVKLCQSNNRNSVDQLNSFERITIPNRYLTSNIHVFHLKYGLQLRGFSGLLTYTDLLKHLMWQSNRPEETRARCFTLTCEARIQHPAFSSEIKFIQSNSIKSEISVDESRKNEVSHQFGTYPNFVVPAKVQQNRLRMRSFNKPRKIEERDVSVEQNKQSKSTPLSFMTNKGIYALVGCIFVTSTILIVTGLLVYFHRKQSENIRLNKQKNKNFVKHKQQNSMELIVNPLLNPDRPVDYANKVCKFNPKLYTELEPIDGLIYNEHYPDTGMGLQSDEENLADFS